MSDSNVPNDFVEHYAQTIFDSVGLLKDGVQVSDIPPIVTNVMKLAKDSVPSISGETKKKVVLEVFRLMLQNCPEDIKSVVSGVLPFAIDAAYYANVSLFKSLSSAEPSQTKCLPCFR